MKYLLILNPSARSGRGKKYWKFWQHGLENARVEYAYDITSGPGDAFRLARKTEGEYIVVAVGGDGTINEVMDGILQSNNPRLQMGVLYAGTSPDFCCFHHIPIDHQNALNTLLQGRATLVDACRIRYVDERGAENIAHFGCSSNIGMGASIARYANQMRRYLGDIIGTGTGVLKTILFHNPLDLNLIADGEPISLEQVNHLAIIKNPYLASGLKLDLDIKTDDGNLWIMAICGQSKIRMLSLLPCCYTGSVTRHSGVFLHKCRQVRIYADVLQEIEFDGDPRGYLPMEIEVLPKALALRK